MDTDTDKRYEHKALKIPALSQVESEMLVIRLDDATQEADVKRKVDEASGMIVALCLSQARLMTGQTLHVYQ